jgi:hypothetical protein
MNRVRVSITLKGQKSTGNILISGFRKMRTQHGFSALSGEPDVMIIHLYLDVHGPKFLHHFCC